MPNPALQTALEAMDESRRQRGENRERAACPAAEAVKARNTFPAGSIWGAFCSHLDPRTQKRLHAETILHLRKNRLTLKRQGRNHRQADARLLDECRCFRESAQHLQAIEDRKARDERLAAYGLLPATPLPQAAE